MTINREKEIKGIKASMIIEILGRPPEHLVETLNNLINDIDKENGVEVLSKNVKEPILVKDQKDFYSTFAEIEVEVEEILYLAILMFKYMPANIEIISPEIIALTNNGWNDIFNELTRRLHKYDEVARIIQIEKGILEKKLREVLEQKKKEKSEGENKPKKKKKVKEEMKEEKSEDKEVK